MRPRKPMLNSTNMSLANAVLIGEFPLGQIGRPYLLDVLLRKLGVIVIFTLCIICAVSALVHHVFDVLSVGTHRKMSWVDTSRVVTRVHDFHAFWYPSVVFNHPRNSVGHVHLPSVRDSELSLASPILGCSPRPTLIGRRFTNFIPKTNEKAFVKHEGYIHGVLT